jgi:hypothetical protein
MITLQTKSQYKDRLQKTQKLVSENQKQFNGAIGNEDLSQIKLLINNSDVDPSFSNNNAISRSLGNWKIFEILKNHEKVNEFDNYRLNLLKSIEMEKGMKVFSYLSQYKDFKKNIGDCLKVLILRDFDMFKGFYNGVLYSEEQKEKEFKELFYIACINNKYEELLFLLERNKSKEINLENFNLSSLMFKDLLSVIVKDNRFLSLFTIDNLLSSAIRFCAVDEIKMLFDLNIDYNYIIIANVLSSRYKSSSMSYFEEVHVKLEKITLLLIKGNKSLEIAKHFKTENCYIYEDFKNEIEKEITKSKIKSF